MRALPDRPFWHISIAGIFFQGGAAAVDTSTIIAALVHGLTAGSALAVGTAAAISRFGWLFPQLFVAYYAQKRASRLPFYMAGALGRVACLVGLAALVWSSAPAASGTVALFFAVWTVYAFVSGIVAVPYNDIVARSIPSGQRSRMLALRFFGGGLLALLVAVIAQRILSALTFADAYAAVLLMGAGLLFVSALSFVTAHETTAPSARLDRTFAEFVRGGIRVLQNDRQFRLFVGAQWLGGASALALPFYVLLWNFSAADVAVLLGAQTAGALLSNPLWGWWGDQLGKRNLLEGSAAVSGMAPALALIWIASVGRWGEVALPYFALIFALLGAVGNGGTIAQLGYLMEISPDDRRPAYSGYFNALVAPVTLLPMAAGAIAQAVDSFVAVFAISGAATVLQFLTIRRMRGAVSNETTDADSTSPKVPQPHR